MKKTIYTLAIALMTGLAAKAQTTTLCNFDFNGSTSLPVSAASTASNITASVNSAVANAAYGGTATGSGAFTQNATAGNALSMANSSGTNTNYWTLTLGGSDLNKYMAYHIYFQAEHSTTGATAITVSWSTDGSTYTALSQTIAPGLNNTFTECFVDLSTINALNGASAVYVRFAASGASGTGTLRMDNLEVQGSESPFNINGANVSFNGAVTAPTLTVSGNFTSGAATVSSLLSGNIKSTTLAGTGSRILLTDATGQLSPLSAGTSSQVLYGNGTWAALPAQTFTTSGSNAYFTGGNLGIGNSSPAYPLDVTGSARVAGVLTANTLSVTGAASFDSLDAGSKLSLGGGAANISMYSGSGNTPNVLGWGTITGGVIHGNPFQNTCLFPVAQGSTWQVLQLHGTQLLPPSSGSSLSQAFDGTNFYIDAAGFTNPQLLLDYYCGHNVGICSGAGGGLTYTGNHLQIGGTTAPMTPQNGTYPNVSLNILSPLATAISVQSSTANRSVFSVANDGSTLINSSTTTNAAPFIVQNAGTNLMTLSANGQLSLGHSSLGINTPAVNNNHPTALLQVNGNVVVGDGNTANSNIWVTTQNWADFVFDANYKLMPLNEVESFYKQNHHLPNVPTQKDIQEQGNNLAQTDVILLQKVEENTLYIVELKKQLEAQQKLIEELAKALKEKK